MYFLDFLLLVARRKLMFIGLPLFCGILGFIMAWILPKTYYTEIRLRVDDPQASGGFTMGVSKDMSKYFGGSADDPAELYLEILGGRENQIAAIKKFKLDSVYKKGAMDLTIKRLTRDLSMDIDDNGLVFCGYQGRDPELAVNLLNFMSTNANDRYVSLQKERLSYNTKFMREKREKLLDSLNSLNKELSTFYNDNNLVNLEDQIELSLKVMADYERQLSSLKMDRRYSQAKGGEGSLNDARTKKKMAILRTEFKKLRGKYNSDYRPSRNSILLNTDWGVEKYLYEEVVRTKIEMLQSLLEVVGEELAISEAQLSRNQAVIQVVQEAYLPDWKIKPKRATWAIVGFVISFTLVTLFSLLQAFMAGQVGENEEARRRIKEILAAMKNKPLSQD